MSELSTSSGLKRKQTNRKVISLYGKFNCLRVYSSLIKKSETDTKLYIHSYTTISHSIVSLISIDYTYYGSHISIEYTCYGSLISTHVLPFVVIVVVGD